MNSTRTALCLLEILLAFTIVTGPVLVLVEMFRTNARAARFNTDQENLELLVGNLMDQLCAEAATWLPDLDQRAGPAVLAQLVKQRRSTLTDENRRRDFDAQLMRVSSTLELFVEQIGGDDFPGLYRVELRARTLFGGSVNALRVVHVPQRSTLATSPDSNSQTSQAILQSATRDP